MSNKLKRWLAFKIYPEAKKTEERFYRLRNQLEYERHWLGYAFPEIDIYSFRILVMDANWNRGLDEDPLPMRAGGVYWSDSIHVFRDQLKDMKKDVKT